MHLSLEEVNRNYDPRPKQQNGEFSNEQSLSNIDDASPTTPVTRNDKT